MEAVVVGRADVETIAVEEDHLIEAAKEIPNPEIVADPSSPDRPNRLKTRPASDVHVLHIIAIFSYFTPDLY